MVTCLERVADLFVTDSTNKKSKLGFDIVEGLTVAAVVLISIPRDLLFTVATSADSASLLKEFYTGGTYGYLLAFIEM